LTSLKSRIQEAVKRRPPRLVESSGLRPGDPLVVPDEDEVYQRACQEWQKTAQIEKSRQSQYIKIDTGPACLAFAADHHFGSSGTDIEAAFKEAELVVSTPGMFLVLIGDMLDQFIIGTLRRARDTARFSIPDEWALVRKYLDLVAPVLVVSVGGNHENWAELLTGVDYFASTLAQIKRDCIYDAHDVNVTLEVDGVSWPGRVRHQWLGTSMYNDTHGIERAVKFDERFTWGAGAHTHRGGVVRSYTADGNAGMAVVAGSYKRVDNYARRKGYVKPGPYMAVAILFDPETESMTGFSDIRMAARVMESLYG